MSGRKKREANSFKLLAQMQKIIIAKIKPSCDLKSAIEVISAAPRTPELAEALRVLNLLNNIRKEIV